MHRLADELPSMGTMSVHRLNGVCPGCGGPREMTLDTDGNGHVIEVPAQDCLNCTPRSTARALWRKELVRSGKRLPKRRPPKQLELPGGVMAKRFGRVWFAQYGDGGVELEPAEIRRVVALLIMGMGVGLVARLVHGVGEHQVRRVRAFVTEQLGEITCACGRPSTHQGRCAERISWEAMVA